MTVYIIEGLDRLGKSTLIDGIKNKLGFHLQFHRQKPEFLSFYDPGLSKATSFEEAGKLKGRALYEYQRACFSADMQLINASSYCDKNGNVQIPIIFDRSWLGEYVYAPMYRGYPGDYVFDLEIEHDIGERDDVVLILLVEDFKISKHFLDDGLSFDISKRQVEQELFIEAFCKSKIKRKIAISVTDLTTGSFKEKDQILAAALNI